MTETNQPVDILFVSDRAMWPRDTGWRVHGLAVMRELVEQGYQVAASSLEPTRGRIPLWLAHRLLPWPSATQEDIHACTSAWSGGPPMTRLMNRLRRFAANHQGLLVSSMAGLCRLVRERQVRAVVALGVNGPMLLWALSRTNPNVIRTWHAADDPVLHQLSMMQCDGGWLLKRDRLRQLAMASVFEASFTRRLHVMLAASPRDERWMKQLSGAASVRLVRNGVDDAHYQSEDDGQPIAFSAVFWGRMDFGPNADAVEHFTTGIWSRLRMEFPSARFFVVGKGVSKDLHDRLSERPGVEVVGEVPDIREWAWRSAVTVLPMRHGFGIKNKLLEAAAMARPIVASPRAVSGLSWNAARPPFEICKSETDWIAAIVRLWTNREHTESLRWRARQWVRREHRWSDAATRVVNEINEHLPHTWEIRPTGRSSMIRPVVKHTHVPSRAAA